jgi:hypothetical protein
MGGVDVDPPALERFASWSDGRYQSLADLRGRMQEVHVPQDSFGHVPGIGARVYHAYDDFVGGCAESVASAADLMDAIATAVRSVVHNYRSTDEAAADSIRAIPEIR